LATAEACRGERNDTNFVGDCGKHISFLRIAELAIS
jgi:hypothetical protein